MLPYILMLVVLLLVALSFGWLSRRAWRARNPFLKWAGAVLSALLALIMTLISVLAAIGILKAYNPKSNPLQNLKVEGTPAQIERGQHLAGAFCVGCHSTTGDFPMTGGQDMGKDLPINLGSFVSVNLTPAGPLKDWTDGEIFRAIRDNVDKDGHRLGFMAGTNVRYLSDEDILAVIAYLRSQEPVENQTPLPPDRANLIGLIMSGAGLLPNPPLVEGVITTPPKAETAEYGKFMTTFLDCTNCHGADLSGGTSPVAPKGPSLRVVKGWTKEDFIRTLRTGIDPSGHALAPVMPWKPTGRLDDVELGALYEYLVSLP